ncbi:porin [Antarcticirhabdus aurantiaca]|uniref:Porin n=1 Tax=Antarcticirhabdus aurantiaca TaxID=2606717 RepID=A0ACD4NIJ6_9HYPH|nr:porin [Antarcticirhabdus aurantiaca]WAJ26625.1 porin [Jeongeuplla avenae]
MNIKSLLLGSAAALVAVTGARAADPIAVEADPVEYVRVCDVYGTGFFYIPGTETCLQISGYARLRYEVVGEQENFEGDDYTAGTRVRGRINFDAREETEYGTLRGFVRLQATNRFGNDARFINEDGILVDSGSNADAAVGLDLAYIQLGGLTIGYLDSLWAERDGLLTDTDWSVGDDKANRISYTFTSEGFSAALSLEDDGSGDFAPDVVGQLAYESGVFSAYVSGVYDEQNDVFGDVAFTNGVITGGAVFADEDDDNGDGAFVVKAGASLKDLLVEGSELKVEGHYAFDPSRYAAFDYVTTFGAYGSDNLPSFAIPIEKQIGLGYSQAVGPFGVAVSGVIGNTFDVYSFNTVTQDVVNVGSTDFYALGLNVGYEVTNNFSILGEVTYRDLDLPGDVEDFDQTTGFVEFLRTF